MNSDGERTAESCAKYCSICGKDVGYYTSIRRLQHVNRCLDSDEQKTNFDNQLKTYNSTIDCPLCQTPLFPGPFRISHLKKCSLQNNVPVRDILKLLETQEKVAEIRKTKNLPHTKVKVPTLASCAPKKKKNTLLPKTLESEQIQLAVGLSLSEAFTCEEASSSSQKSKSLDSFLSYRHIERAKKSLEHSSPESKLSTLQNRLIQLVSNNVTKSSIQDNSLCAEKNWWIMQGEAKVDLHPKALDSSVELIVDDQQPSTSSADATSPESPVINAIDSTDKIDLNRSIISIERSATPDLFDSPGELSRFESSSILIIPDQFDHPPAENTEFFDNCDDIPSGQCQNLTILEEEAAEDRIPANFSPNNPTKSYSSYDIKTLGPREIFEENVDMVIDSDSPLFDRIRKQMNRNETDLGMETLRFGSDYSADHRNDVLRGTASRDFRDQRVSPRKQLLKRPMNLNLAVTSSGPSDKDNLKFNEGQQLNQTFTILKQTNVTPMPEYNRLSSPELTSELSKYGMKGMARRRAVPMLRRLFDETHPYLNQRGDLEVRFSQDDIKLNSRRIKKSKNNRLSCSQPTKSSGEAKKRRMNSNTVSINKKISISQDCALDEKASSSEDECDENNVAEESFIPIASQDVTPLEESNVEDRLRHFFTSNSTLYNKILCYQPLPLKETHNTIKSSGIKCSLNTLMNFLDLQCITFTMKDERKNPGVAFKPRRKQ